MKSMGVGNSLNIIYLHSLVYLITINGMAHSTVQPHASIAKILFLDSSDLFDKNAYYFRM